MSEPAANESDHLVQLSPTALVRGARRHLLVSLAMLTVGAWALTLYHTVYMGASMGIAARGDASVDGSESMGSMADMAMSGVSAAGWSVGGAAAFVALWTVMMAAMMLPAAAPMILIFASAQARRARDVAVPTWIFVAGYLLVWLAAGVLVYVLVQIGSDIVTRLAPAKRAEWGPLALGATLIGAGLYQFTPLKRVCLNHCRSPFAFVALHWRDGRLGALRMGARHGAYCFGCCWALFAVLVAAGVMSLAWMLLLTLVVFAEKAIPQTRRFSPGIGFALIALGVTVASGAVSMSWIA